MDYVIEISGGIGKHVLATSFIKWLNEKYPKRKIYVISAYPEIFEYNPRIYRNLHLSQPYLFEDYIKGKDYRKGEPYRVIEYYREKNKKHLREVFPKAYGFNTFNKEPTNELFLTKGEQIDGQVYAQQNGPYITFQALGGLPPGASPNRAKIDSSWRDMPRELAFSIVKKLNERGFKVLQLRNNQEPIIPGTMQINLPVRNIIPLVKEAKAHIGIDSVWMHVAGTFKKPMLTFWGSTHKDNLGYTHEGSINAFNEFGMHCRPRFGLPDREAMFPYKDKKEGFEFEYTEKQIDKYLDQLLE
jgi:hypothetical protein